MIVIINNHDDDLERLLKKYKTKIDKSRIQQIIKKRKHFIKHSILRKIKKNTALLKKRETTKRNT